MNLDDHIRRAPVRQRATIAEWVGKSEIPLLRAFATALIAANAHEAATTAELEVALWRDHAAEMAEIAANLPEPGKGTND
jgi:hypothetical protein